MAKKTKNKKNKKKKAPIIKKPKPTPTPVKPTPTPVKPTPAPVKKVPVKKAPAPVKKVSKKAPKNKHVRRQGKRPKYSMVPKIKKLKNKAITKNNKIVPMPSQLRPGTLDYVLWKAQRNTIRIKKIKFKQNEMFGN